MSLVGNIASILAVSQFGIACATFGYRLWRKRRG